MKVSSFRDNEILTGVSILSVLYHSNELELSKCILIEPLLSYSKVLTVLKRTNSTIKSIEDLIIKESIVFSNFDSRFQEKLLLSINSILLFESLGLIEVRGCKLKFAGYDFNFGNSSLGSRTKSRIAASRKLAEVLMKGDASDFYLSLRVEI